MATKGQNIRLYVEDDSAMIAAATSLTLNINVQMEDASTKDTTNGWAVQEPVSISWDCSTDALVYDADPVDGGTADLLKDWVDWVPTIGDSSSNCGLVIKIVQASGDNNRTEGTILARGGCLISGLTVNAQNRQNATYTVNFAGEGALS